MGFGETLKEIATQYGVTQEQIAVTASVDRTTVTKYCNGSRKVTEHFVQAVTKELDNPRLCLEAIGEITGGAFYFPWLDGESVDLSIRSIDEKIREEAEEVFQVIDQRTRGVRLEVYYQDEELAGREVGELIDLAHACCLRIAAVCLVAGLSPQKEFRKHREKLIARGYKKKAPALTGA